MSSWHKDIDVGDKCVGDKFKIFVSDLIHCDSNDSVVDILNRSPS